MINVVQSSAGKKRPGARRPPPRARAQSQPRKQKKQKQKGFKLGKTKDSAINQSTRLYRDALANPFSTSILGVRAPDSICYPTITAHKRVLCKVTTSGAGTIGALFLPFPSLSVWVPDGAFSGCIPYTNNPALGYVATPTQLAQVMKTYRVVAWGIRVSLADTNSAAKGQIIVAPVLLPINLPGFSMLEAIPLTNSTTAVQSVFSVPPCDSNLANLPGAVAINVQDFLSKGEYVGRAPPYDSAALNFRRTVNSTTWNVGTNWTTESIYNTGTGTISQPDHVEFHQSAGFIGLAMYGTGMPINTNEINVELIYHIEGMPDPSLSLVPTSTPSPAGSTSIVERVLTGLTAGAKYFELANDSMNRGVNLASTAAVMYGRYRMFKK